MQAISATAEAAIRGPVDDDDRYADAIPKTEDRTHSTQHEAQPPPRSFLTD